MPLITVDDEGHRLFYEDTGSPSSDESITYTTLIVIHGTAFHGSKWLRLHFVPRFVLTGIDNDN